MDALHVSVSRLGRAFRHLAAGIVKFKEPQELHETLATLQRVLCALHAICRSEEAQLELQQVTSDTRPRSPALKSLIDSTAAVLHVAQDLDGSPAKVSVPLGSLFTAATS
jgi:hypothetical protein